EAIAAAIPAGPVPAVEVEAIARAFIDEDLRIGLGRHRHARDRCERSGSRQAKQCFLHGSSSSGFIPGRNRTPPCELGSSAMRRNRNFAALLTECSGSRARREPETCKHVVASGPSAARAAARSLRVPASPLWLPDAAARADGAPHLI